MRETEQGREGVEMTFEVRRQDRKRKTCSKQILKCNINRWELEKKKYRLNAKKEYWMTRSFHNKVFCVDGRLREGNDDDAAMFYITSTHFFLIILISADFAGKMNHRNIFITHENYTIYDKIVDYFTSKREKEKIKFQHQTHHLTSNSQQTSWLKAVRKGRDLTARTGRDAHLGISNNVSASVMKYCSGSTLS